MSIGLEMNPHPEEKVSENFRRSLRFNNPLIVLFFLIVNLFRYRRRTLPAELLVSGDIFNFGRTGLISQLKQQLFTFQKITSTNRSLFSPFYYLSLYPDVRVSGANPWIHYHRHGRFEGRSPHPLIDPNFMVDQLKIPYGSLLDRYLSQHEYWGLKTNAYIRVRDYISSGYWNSNIAPTFDLVIQGLDKEPWVSQKLPIINLASVSNKRFMQSAVSVLLALNPGVLHKEISVSDVTVIESTDGFSEGTLSCSPGWAIYGHKEIFWLGDQTVLSPDMTAIFLDSLLVRIPDDEQTIAASHIFLLNQVIGITDLCFVVKALPRGAVVCPNDNTQGHVIRYILEANQQTEITVLEHGTSFKIRTHAIPRVVQTPSYDFESNSKQDFHTRNKKILVLHPSTAKKMLSQNLLNAYIINDYELCLIEKDIEPWLPSFFRAGNVILDTSLKSISWIFPHYVPVEILE